MLLGLDAVIALTTTCPTINFAESEALLEDLARYKAKQNAQPQGAPEAFQASNGKNTSVVSRTNTSGSSTPLQPRATQWDKAPGEEVERPATLRDNIDKVMAHLQTKQFRQHHMLRRF